MNTCALVGRVTKDIEMRKTQSGKSVASFTLAVNRRGKDAGADFIPCVAWERTAETLSNYVHKGDRLGIEGSVSTRSYDDKYGQKHYVTEIAVHSIEFMQDKKQNQEPKQENQNSNEYPYGINPSDLPF